MDNELLDKIEKIMSEVDDSWSDFEKSRYIFVKLGQLYSYDPKFAYSNSKVQNDILIDAIKINTRKIEENLETLEIKDFINDKNKICVSLSNIYTWLLKRVGVENVEQLSSDVIIKTEYGKVIAKLEEGLLSCKMMTKPEGFHLVERTSEQEEIIRNADIKLSLIEKDYNKVESKDESAKEKTIHERLEKILKNSNEYFEKVIGRKINNVELHKYYNYLLGTSFRRKNAQIFPFHTEEFSELQYIVIGKEENTEDYCYFLYDLEDEVFKEKTQEEIKQILGKNIKVATKYEQYIKDNPIYERD